MPRPGIIERNILQTLFGNKLTRDEIAGKTGYNVGQVSGGLERLKARMMVTDVGRCGKLKIYTCCLDVTEDYFCTTKPKSTGSGIITPAPYERGYRWWGGGGRLF